MVQWGETDVMDFGLYWTNVSSIWLFHEVYFWPLAQAFLEYSYTFVYWNLYQLATQFNHTTINNKEQVCRINLRKWQHILSQNVENG